MALAFTASNVKPAVGNATQPSVAFIATGVTVTAGQPVTLNASGQVVLAANTSNDLSGLTYGLFIAGAGGAAGQPIALYPASSLIDFGPAVFPKAGEIVVLGAAGVLELPSDQAAGDRQTIVGVSTTTAILRILSISTGIQLT